MKRVVMLAVALGFIVTTALAVGTPRTTEAAPPNPFAGEWSAIARQPTLANAHLEIRGGRRVVGLRLVDNDDRLFCNSQFDAPVRVEAVGIGVVTGPKTLDVLYFYHCSDGTSGFGTTTYSFSLVPGAGTDSMIDTTGHFWTRL
ncbi:MAG TPA: hypothetical protein VI759_05630 [Dehalococcoidia bacterium]|nr:hypothetical protein [Dehalococcoidia bacterium]